MVGHGRRAGNTRTFAPRFLAGFAGVLLAAFAGFAWYLAELLLSAVDKGDAALTGAGVSTAQFLTASGDGMEIDVAIVGASNLERLGHTVLGNVTSATEQFQMLVLLSVMAGAAAVAVAARRRPLHRWPEWLWVVAAAIALTPAIVLHLWLLVSVPLAALMALAALLHLTRRHDLTLARGRAAARRGGEVATAGVERGRAQLPAARAQAEALTQRGKALADRSAPKAGAAVRRLREKARPTRDDQR